MFIVVPNNPNILEVGERLLVIGMLYMHGEGMVVHERDAPELGDGLDEFTALLKHGIETLDGLAFWRKEVYGRGKCRRYGRDGC